MNRRGFGTTEILVALGLLGVLLAGMLAMGRIAGKQQVKSNSTFFADTFRRSLTEMLQNEAAWQNTVADPVNASLACLRNGTSCTGAGGPLRVRDLADNVFYDALTSPTRGFTPTGVVCDSFDGANGNDACPFRFELTWTPICGPGCLAPQIRLQGIMRYSPRTVERTIAFNGANYGVNFVRGGPDSEVVWRAAGITSVVYFNGNGNSQEVTVNFPRPCPLGRAVIVTQSYVASVRCGNGAGPTICNNDPGTNSTDLQSSIGNITTTSFRVHVSTNNGVWVGAASPPFPVGYQITCLR